MLKFKQDDIIFYTKNYRKRPLIVEAKQINEPFEVETLEGTMKGKPGNYLMIGIKGELYICDQQI